VLQRPEFIMKHVCRRIVFGLLCSLLTALCMAAPDEQTPAPLQDKHSQEILQAMSRSSTWGHPDQYGEFMGIKRYAAGDYAGAMKYFLVGAHFADKPSQLCIGLLYLNGEGVQKDPVTAYAWIALAAERNFPQFVASREQVWAKLDAGQRDQAKALSEKLLADYGDAVAKPRLATQLRLARMQSTQARLGFVYDVQAYTAEQFFSAFHSHLANSGEPLPPCGEPAIKGSAITGCNDFYAESRWNPPKYFEVRDSSWLNTVNVGALQSADGVKAQSNP
jgi:uncharacterized protein